MMDLSAIHKHLDEQDGRRGKRKYAKPLSTNPHDPCPVCGGPVTQRDDESAWKYDRRKTCSSHCGRLSGAATRGFVEVPPKLCECGCGVWFHRKPTEGVTNFKRRRCATTECYARDRAAKRPARVKAAKASKVAGSKPPKPLKPEPKPEPVSTFDPDARLPTPKVLLKQQHTVGAPKPTRYRWCDKHNERIGAYGCTGCNVENRNKQKHERDRGEFIPISNFSSDMLLER